MGSRNWGWFYHRTNAPNGLMSASKYAKLTGCLTYAGFRYMERQKEEMGPAAVLGDMLHGQMEAWDKCRVMPTHPAALAALRYAPAPGRGLTEVPCRYDFSGVSWFGYLDGVYNWEGNLARDQGRILPLEPDAHTVIHDWKFTGNLDYTLTEEELRADAAANFYAMEAYRGGARIVSCRWIYTKTSGSHPTKEVWTYMPLMHVVSKMQEMSTKAAEWVALEQLYRDGKLKVLDLPKDTNHCFAYKRVCAFKDQCQPESVIRMPAAEGDESMTEAFKNAMANIPGLPVVPPKVPVKPSTPPPVPPPTRTAPHVPLAPPKAPVKAGLDDLTDAEAKALVTEHLVAQGKDPRFVDLPVRSAPVVEAGFVNSPRYAPAVPPASPEEAAAMQGVTKAEPAAVAEDDLTALNKDQLRALCLQQQLITEKQRPREEKMRELIRAARIQAGDELLPLPAEAVIQRLVESLHNTFAEALPQAKVDKAAVTYDDPPAAQPKGFVLYINISGPTTGSSVQTHELVDWANDKLNREHPEHPRDYRYIKYTAVADFVCAVNDILQTAVVDEIYLNTRTPEGSALENVLCSLASKVYRGTV